MTDHGTGRGIRGRGHNYAPAPDRLSHVTPHRVSPHKRRAAHTATPRGPPAVRARLVSSEGIEVCQLLELGKPSPDLRRLQRQQAVETKVLDGEGRHRTAGNDSLGHGVIRR